MYGLVGSQGYQWLCIVWLGDWTWRAVADGWHFYDWYPGILYVWYISFDICDTPYPVPPFLSSILPLTSFSPIPVAPCSYHSHCDVHIITRTLCHVHCTFLDSHRGALSLWDVAWPWHMTVRDTVPNNPEVFCLVVNGAATC